MMDRHDMDDFALLAALIIESRIGALVLGFLGKAVQKAGVFAFTLPRRSFRTYDHG